MKLLGYTYQIERSTTCDNWGEFIPSAGKMIVHASLNSDQAQSTLLHEILEALNYHLELNLKHPMIMGLEAGLYQTLTQNGVNLAPLLKENV